MKILVMDDEAQILRLVTEILHAEGHEVLCAEDGIAGMALFRKEAPEIVITDIIMLEQEGIETILAIRRESPEVKIIAISGAGPVGDCRRTEDGSGLWRRRRDIQAVPRSGIVKPGAFLGICDIILTPAAGSRAPKGFEIPKEPARHRPPSRHRRGRRA